jgi:hypothetical protein
MIFSFFDWLILRLFSGIVTAFFFIRELPLSGPAWRNASGTS